MKKILFAILAIFPISVLAAEDAPKSDWVLNIRRIGIDWSRVDVKNGDRYYDSPIAQLKAASQDSFAGMLDTVLEYRYGNISWDNSLLMNYGRLALKPSQLPETVTETVDQILLSTKFDYSLWQYEGLKFGPTARGTYDTEFTANGKVPRRQQIRAGAGLAMYDHPIIKDLYAIGIYEYDFTYAADQTSKEGVEFGWRIEYEIHKGIKATTNGYYRDYFAYSDFVGTDLEWDLLAIARLDSNLWGNFTMGPYVQYRRAKSREADVVASNFMMGISFNYITKFGL